MKTKKRAIIRFSIIFIISLVCYLIFYVTNNKNPVYQKKQKVIDINFSNEYNPKSACEAIVITQLGSEILSQGVYIEKLVIDDFSANIFDKYDGDMNFGIGTKFSNLRIKMSDGHTYGSIRTNFSDNNANNANKAIYSFRLSSESLNYILLLAYKTKSLISICSLNGAGGKIIGISIDPRRS